MNTKGSKDKRMGILDFFKKETFPIAIGICFLRENTAECPLLFCELSYLQGDAKFISGAISCGDFPEEFVPATTGRKINENVTSFIFPYKYTVGFTYNSVSF